MPLRANLRSTGDLRADRRYEYARGAFDEGDFATAADLARQVLELAPDFAPAYALLGRSEVRLGQGEAAISSLRRALERAPDDELGIRLDLARLGALTPQEPAITEGYVRALFDDYAPRFDTHLKQGLSYRGPELIAQALQRVRPAQAHEPAFGKTLDLGCGTGLMAKALEGRYRDMEGVDLSPRMLDEARKTGLYSALHESELTAFLKDRPDAEADLVVAADVFVYIASLEKIFDEASRVLRRDGLFTFTVQAHGGEGVSLGDDARYAHSEGYLRTLAATAGMSVAILETVSTRLDRERPVPGLLAVLGR